MVATQSNDISAGAPRVRSQLGRAMLAAVAFVLLVAAGALGAVRDVRAQSTAFTPQELGQLLAPIALYPDALLSQTLIAAGYPSEVTQAADWLRRNPQWKGKGDDAVRAADAQPWDASVRSLVAFPQVLEMMDANRDWMQQVGDAFVGQRADTMSAVQALRVQAELAGNLKSNEEVTVSREAQTVVIRQASPQVIYVPVYDPGMVYGPWPYPTYPPYYLPPPPGYYVGSALAAGIAFGVGIAITNAIWGGFDWGRGDVTINVNHFNNVHVSNTQIYSRNPGRWEHDRTHRRDVPFGDRSSRERVQRAAVTSRDRSEFAGFDRSAPQAGTRAPSAARPAVADRAAPQPVAGRPAARPAVADRGSFDGLERPAPTRPAPAVPSARPAQPARPAVRPEPGVRPAPRPAPAARPAPTSRPAPAARPAAGGRPAPQRATR